MSKSTRSLIIAATAATLFLAGCATQGTGDNGSGSFTTGNSCGRAVAAPVNACKGMTKCKSHKAKKRHHVKRKMKTVKKEVTSDTTTSTTTGDAAAK